MDASTIGKHIAFSEYNMREAMHILDMGVHDDISEECALLCADTQLMLARMQIEDARKVIRDRQANMRLAEEQA